MLLFIPKCIAGFRGCINHIDTCHVLPQRERAEDRVNKALLFIYYDYYDPILESQAGLW